MNKLFVLTATAALAIACQSAQLDWRYNATSADAGQTVYVMLGSEAVQEWENLDAVKAASISNGDVANKGRNQFAATGTAVSSSITTESASIYYVVVASDGSTFGVTSVSDMTGSVYDPADPNNSTAKTANTTLSSGSITKNGIAWGTGGGDDPGPGPDDPPTPGPGDDGGVPEPTSGILLMIGGAALALRRRR